MPSEPKPGTPLPWQERPKIYSQDMTYPSGIMGPNGEDVLSGSYAICREYDDEFQYVEVSDQDLRYIVHACNTLAELQKPCVWTHSGAIPGMTKTSCGVVAGIMVYAIGDSEADVKFCCFCQRPVESHPITESENDQ